MTTLRVDVWSDVACPWCYVGKKRLSDAAEMAGVELELVWHAFELDPRPVTSQATTDYVQYLAQKYGRSLTEARSMIDGMARVGLEEGIAFDFESAVFANTFDAHRLLKWAYAEFPEKQNALAAALFDAHLCEGRDLNQPGELIAIAARVGLDTDAASAVLASDAYAPEVREDEAGAREMGVSGVPFYVIGQYGVGGAQRPETFERVFTRALLEQAAEAASIGLAEGASCGPDGC